MDNFINAGFDECNKKILIIEPFYGGSHKILLDVILSSLSSNDYFLITMSPKKWPWRARCSALYISQNIPYNHHFKHIVCSSVLPLAELIGLRPDLTNLSKIVYFHENQLTYPVKVIKKRDYQYGYNEITTCLAADIVLFNSKFNKDSFLYSIEKFTNIMPDYRPKNVFNVINSKAHVIYFPLDLELILNIKMKYKQEILELKKKNEVKHIVWAHRWEFDKNPALFFQTLRQLKHDFVQFKVSILGDSFSEVPLEFCDAKILLKEELVDFGYIHSREEYYKALLSADIVISTADHEFFGVSIAEGIICGCMPLLPNKLVYPEFYPEECLYSTEKELFTKLKRLCLDSQYFQTLKNSFQVNLSSFDKRKWVDNFLSISDLEKYKIVEEKEI